MVEQHGLPVIQACALGFKQKYNIDLNHNEFTSSLVNVLKRFGSHGHNVSYNRFAIPRIEDVIFSSLNVKVLSDGYFCMDMLSRALEDDGETVDHSGQSTNRNTICQGEMQFIKNLIPCLIIMLDQANEVNLPQYVLVFDEIVARLTKICNKAFFGMEEKLMKKTMVMKKMKFIGGKILITEGINSKMPSYWVLAHSLKEYLGKMFENSSKIIEEDATVLEVGIYYYQNPYSRAKFGNNQDLLEWMWPSVYGLCNMCCASHDSEMEALTLLDRLWVFCCVTHFQHGISEFKHIDKNWQRYAYMWRKLEETSCIMSNDLGYQETRQMVLKMSEALGVSGKDDMFARALISVGNRKPTSTKEFYEAQEHIKHIFESIAVKPHRMYETHEPVPDVISSTSKKDLLEGATIIYAASLRENTKDIDVNEITGKMDYLVSKEANFDPIFDQQKKLKMLTGQSLELLAHIYDMDHLIAIMTQKSAIFAYARSMFSSEGPVKLCLEELKTIESNLMDCPSLNMINILPYRLLSELIMASDNTGVKTKEEHAIESSLLVWCCINWHKLVWAGISTPNTTTTEDSTKDYLQGPMILHTSTMAKLCSYFLNDDIVSLKVAELKGLQMERVMNQIPSALNEHETLRVLEWKSAASALFSIVKICSKSYQIDDTLLDKVILSPCGESKFAVRRMISEQEFTLDTLDSNLLKDCVERLAEVILNDGLSIEGTPSGDHQSIIFVSVFLYHHLEDRY